MIFAQVNRPCNIESTVHDKSLIMTIWWIHRVMGGVDILELNWRQKQYIGKDHWHVGYLNELYS